MSIKTAARLLRLALCSASALGAMPATTMAQTAPDQTAPTQTAHATPTLEEEFRDPPPSARPRVWWHWMNGNITKDGIAKDMAWMKAVGIGGLTNFDVNLMTPQIVPHRLAYMTPEWKDAFRFAASEADRLGLELAIASSPGWSETGGPWVKPEDALKKLVWSETRIAAGRPFAGRLAAPPSITGPFQSLAKPMGIDDVVSNGKPAEGPRLYGDIAVLAVPDMTPADTTPSASVTGGGAIDPAALLDNDLMSGAAVPRGPAQAPGTLTYSYAQPQTMRSATVFIPGAKVMFRGPIVAPALETSEDGVTWRHLADIPVSDTPATISFAPVTARFFRLVLRPLASTGSNMGEPGAGTVIPGLFGAMEADPNKPWQVNQFTLSGEAQVDQFETKAGFNLALDYFKLGGPEDGARGPAPAQVIDLTAKMRPDGTLDWTPPALPAGGSWRILRMGYSLLGTTNHPAPAEATGLEVDKFDGDAVRRYLEHYLAMYEETTGPALMGKHGVRALLTDSIEVGAANWTPKLIAQFKALRGYDPTPWLPTLAGVLIGSRADTDRFLFDWRRTLGDLMSSQHYATVAKVAHEHGLKVYGEALEDHRPSLGDDMAMRSHTDIPMSAMWTFSQKAGPNPTYLADIKGAASVAHIYGQNLVAAESMTSALNYWGDSPRTLKHVIDLEFVTGVNRPVVHTSVHQPEDDKLPGLSLLIFGQYFNRHEAWAPLARAWVDYMARNALMLQQGRDVADVGYVYGEEAPLTGLYGDKPVADAPKTHAYDFINNAALTGALRNDGADLVTPGGARYQALYLGGSSQHMTLPTLRKLAALVEGGARVVGLAPRQNPGLGDDAGEYRALVARLWPGSGDARVGKGRVIASADIENALAKLGIDADFRLGDAAPDADVPFLHRRWVAKDGGTSDDYFLVNRKDRPEGFEAHFRVTGKLPELWHAETGTFETVGYRIVKGETLVRLDMAPEDAVHVVFRKPAPAPAMMIDKARPVPLSTVTGAWQVSFQSGRGAPSGTTLPALQSLSRNADAGIRYFSGLATYTRDIDTPAGWHAGQKLWLDLGQVNEVAQVSINGKVVGTAWHAPYRLDISRAVHAGANHVEVKVANLWVNRLIGDAQPDMQKPGAHKITFTAMPTYRADAPLRPSGLIGPVVLEGAGKGR
ncbi:MAG: glycoside hydrolase [Sphingomonadales bacterium]|nr:glycoside hydrolase [Sphingomonadales bacterium]MDE2167854.1 glycoside hydrolase [Sphingomonadales bacterium]